MTAMPPPEMTREHGLHLLSQMLRIRCFEDRCAELYSAGKIRGFLHLYNGEEASATGVGSPLVPGDKVAGIDSMTSSLPIAALLLRYAG